MAVEGPTTREVFETYLEKVLAPALREGQIAVMDNLSSHKSSRVRELIFGTQEPNTNKAVSVLIPHLGTRR